MIIRLRFFASVRERLRRSEAELSVGENATVDDVCRILCQENPQLADLASSLSFAVNQEYVQRSHPLSDNDELALIPPVSGG